MFAVETRALSKAYGGRLAVNNLNMHVPSSAIYGFVGKNGAGKSTAMKMIASLVAPTSGEILLYGDSIAREVGDKVQATRRLGTLIEDPGIYPTLSAFDNLMCKALALGVSHPKSRCEDVLQTVGLGEVARMRTKKFSLGMKQRLGIGLALLTSPDLLLLDEPFNGLDPEGTRDLRILIETLNRTRGVTVLISSHVLDQLDRIATCYGVIANGHMVRELTAAQMEQECGDSLHIKVDHPERALVILQEKLPEASLSMAPGDMICIKGISDADQIARTLHDAGFVVLELSVMKRDIEEFFVELMEDAKGGGSYVQSA